MDSTFIWEQSRSTITSPCFSHGSSCRWSGVFFKTEADCCLPTPVSVMHLLAMTRQHAALAAACDHSTPNRNMHYLDVDAPRKTWPEWLDLRAHRLFYCLRVSCINTQAEKTETLPRNQSGLMRSHHSIPCRITPSARSPLPLPKDFLLLLLDRKGNGKKHKLWFSGPQRTKGGVLSVGGGEKCHIVTV